MNISLGILAYSYVCDPFVFVFVVFVFFERGGGGDSEKKLGALACIETSRRISENCSLLGMYVKSLPLTEFQASTLRDYLGPEQLLYKQKP